MTPDPAESLAEAARESIRTCCAEDPEPCLICQNAQAALAVFDAARPVREAEGRFIDAAVLWAPTIVAKLEGTYPSEVVRALKLLLAAREPRE